MSIPATVWTPRSGNGEIDSTGNPTLQTEASIDLLTEAGDTIVLEDSELTPTPTTIWTEDEGI